jgi:K+-transporting ATPase ATPase C chain
MTLLKKDIVASVIGMLILTLFLGLLYPLVVTGISQVAFPGNANGQKVYVDGRLVGSKIIGQDWKGEPQYFQTRPSGTTPADNAAGTAFSNYGPNSVITEKAIKSNIDAYIALNGKYYPGGLTAAKIPVDAADTSASGIDPDVSPANARIQAYRIAAVRHLTLKQVDGLIDTYTAGRGLGFSGEPGVNVLELNLALNRISHGG